MVIDFEKSDELVKKFNVKELPTTILIRDENVVHTFSSLFFFDELINIIKQKDK